MPITLDNLRRFAVARSLFEPTTLKGALDRMGFVQADPIRAPARAQDLTLRHRVKDYRAGDLERLYVKLDIEEDYFVVYGFVPRSVQALMHPRSVAGIAWLRPWNAARKKRAQLLLEFVRERGAVHPREVDDYFAHGKVTNYWGGSSNATTHLLDAMHYRGMLRVTKRESGVRIYAVHQHAPEPLDAAERERRIDALVDALERARQRLAHARVDGADWYWPAEEDAARCAPPDAVRLLTPFDPVVWDRDRYERLWGWVYRFEAYTPAPKRKLGYYALPLLWRDRVIGWANLSVMNGRLEPEFGYITTPPRDRAFQRELEAELDRMRAFLALES